MDLPPETALAYAERRVADGEQLVACQIDLIKALEWNNHPDEAAIARGVLARMLTALALVRERLWREQEGAERKG